MFLVPVLMSSCDLSFRVVYWLLSGSRSSETNIEKLTLKVNQGPELVPQLKISSFHLHLLCLLILDCAKVEQLASVALVCIFDGISSEELCERGFA